MTLTILGDIVVAYLFIVIVLVFIVALCRAAGRELPAPPSREYADDFASKLSGSDESHDSSSLGPSDPDIVFASALTQPRRAGLAAAHPHAPTTRKETETSSEALASHRAAASHPHLYIVH